MAWLWAALGIMVLAYVGTCVFYAVFQERFIFIRFRTAKGYVYTFPPPFEERFLTTSDGARLHALYFKAREPRRRGALLPRQYGQCPPLGQVRSALRQAGL